MAEKFSRWGVAVGNLKEHLEEMPHIAPDLTEMERMLGEARTLESRQEALRGEAREIAAQLLELAKSGEKLRSRLRAHLQAKFGATSENLLKFGFRPRRTPRRTRATQKPAPQGDTPQPPEASPPGSTAPPPSSTAPAPNSSAPAVK